MNQKTAITLMGVVVGAFLLLSNTFFIMDERETGFIMQFGEAKRVVKEPGLHIKVPLMQEVIRYDSRLLSIDIPEIEVTASDGKRIKINLFTRYIITNPIRFYKTVRSQRGAEERLAQNIPGAMLRVIGQVPLKSLFTDQRAQVMDTIHKKVRQVADRYGINVKDVRIIAAEFPTENRDAIFNRMRTQRVQEAKLYRAQGQKRANEIQATADRKSREIIAGAKKDAALVRGQADAEATRIYAKAFGRDSAFFEFWRSLRAYKVALKSEKTTYLMTPEGSFFKHFKKK